jgi:hypothetical protein
MTSRKLSGFLDALSAGRRPTGFTADPEEAQVIQTAITLRAARPGDAAPRQQFVDDLYEALSEPRHPAGAATVRPLLIQRGRAALVAVAASVALVGGTFFATETLGNSTLTTAISSAPEHNALRTASFVTPDGSVLGQIVVSRGHPSWVYMNVGVPQSGGTVLCRLQLKDGTVVAAGTIAIHNGMGTLAKSVHVDISRLRGAQLFSPTGGDLASATFA